MGFLKDWQCPLPRYTSTFFGRGVCVRAHMLARLHIVMEAKRRCPLSGAFGENRTVTNSRDGCGVSGTSITVHLITHPFWSGPSSECGIYHGVSLSLRSAALQSFNSSASLALRLSVSLYLSPLFCSWVVRQGDMSC